MEHFSDFAEENGHVVEGDKIKIADVLNKEVVATKFRMLDSKYKDNGSECLQLQIKIDDEKRVIFTGSKVLIKQAKRYAEHMPFLTTIKQIDRYYTFT